MEGEGGQGSGGEEEFFFSVGSEKVLENLSWGSWKVLEKAWIFCQ